MSEHLKTRMFEKDTREMADHGQWSHFVTEGRNMDGDDSLSWQFTREQEDYVYFRTPDSLRICVSLLRVTMPLIYPK